MISDEELGEKSVTTTTEFNSDARSSSKSADEEVDSLVECTSFLETQREKFYSETHKDEDVIIVWDGFETVPSKNEEICTVNASCESYLVKTKDVCGDCDVVQKDCGKDSDVRLIVRSFEEAIGNGHEISTVLDIVEKNRGEDREEKDINTAFNGVEKDLGKGKDLSAVLTGVETEQGRGENFQSEDLSTVLAGIGADLARDEDQTKTAKEDGQTAELDYLLLEPPEEFRV